MGQIFSITSNLQDSVSGNHLASAAHPLWLAAIRLPARPSQQLLLLLEEVPLSSQDVLPHPTGKVDVKAFVLPHLLISNWALQARSATACRGAADHRARRP